MSDLMNEKEKEEEKKPKKKREYSKIITSIIILIFVAIAVWSMYEYFILVELSIREQSVNVPDSTLPVTSITTILGAALSYFIYQGYLKGSLNRNKLAKDENGLIKAILDRETVENLIEALIENQEQIEQQEQIENQETNQTRAIGFFDNDCNDEE